MPAPRKKDKKDESAYPTTLRGAKSGVQWAKEDRTIKPYDPDDTKTYREHGRHGVDSGRRI